ncbi:hypothetical protein [Streptomyces sp. NPDC008121]|uniref:hypothetical protein n=1 Tax=Streptomyces sp. NPDC008121 TaxID=3364809 RepID=UPI0036E929A6
MKKEFGGKVAAVAISAPLTLGLLTGFTADARAASPAPASAGICEIQESWEHVNAIDGGFAGYMVNNLQAEKRTNLFGAEYYTFSLKAEPAGCSGGEYFQYHATRNEVSGVFRTPAGFVESTRSWRNVNFTMPTAEDKIVLLYGDPSQPDDARYVGEVARWLEPQ